MLSPPVTPAIFLSCTPPASCVCAVSVPAMYGWVKRPRSIVLYGFDAESESKELRLEGMSARLAQQAIDQLDGITFMTRAPSAKFLVSSPSLEQREFWAGDWPSEGARVTPPGVLYEERDPIADEAADPNAADRYSLAVGGRHRAPSHGGALGRGVSEDDDEDVDGWLSEWGGRISAWASAQPDQARLGDCLGALGLHLGARLRGLLGPLLLGGGLASTPPPSSASADCEWMGREGERLNLPEFPKIPTKLESRMGRLMGGAKGGDPGGGVSGGGVSGGGVSGGLWGNTQLLELFPIPRLLPKIQPADGLLSHGLLSQGVRIESEPTADGVGVAGGSVGVRVAGGVAPARSTSHPSASRPSAIGWVLGGTGAFVGAALALGVGTGVLELLRWRRKSSGSSEGRLSVKRYNRRRVRAPHAQ